MTLPNLKRGARYIRSSEAQRQAEEKARNERRLAEYAAKRERLFRVWEAG